MSYLSQAQLTQNEDFHYRSSSAAIEQASSFRNDQRPDFVALSESLLKGDFIHIQAFVRLNAAGPGIAEKADVGGGEIDQAMVTDGDLLALTQANFPVIVDLYFNIDGSPKL